MRYGVVGPPGYSVMDLKTIQDSILERNFKAYRRRGRERLGSKTTKAYQVTIDQEKLIHYGLTIPNVLSALNNANINVGGQTVNFGAQAAVVRGVGLIHSLDDIENTMISATNGTPVLIRPARTPCSGSGRGGRAGCPPRTPRPR